MIRVDRLSVRFPGFSLRDIDLRVEKGEFFALLGPTGAGKTVILESIAGLVAPSGGRIRIAGREVTHLPPEKRGVGIVYQDHALFPHLNVRQNIAFGLRYHRPSSGETLGPSHPLVGSLGLSHLLERPVDRLSGGEKQRVALARALAIDPPVLLLDEPLSSLDPNFRDDIRRLLRKLHRETGITVLMVTHDFSEAHFLAERAAVMHGGRIEQTGRVADVFGRPATAFVAGFVGMKNIFPAVFADGLAQVGGLAFEIGAAAAGRTLVAIRPEHVQLYNRRPRCRHRNVVEGTVVGVSNQGMYFDVTVGLAGIELRAVMAAGALQAMEIDNGRRVFVEIDPGAIHPI